MISDVPDCKILSTAFTGKSVTLNHNSRSAQFPYGQCNFCLAWPCHWKIHEIPALTHGKSIYDIVFSYPRENPPSSSPFQFCVYILFFFVWNASHPHFVQTPSYPPKNQWKSTPHLKMEKWKSAIAPRENPRSSSTVHFCVHILFPFFFVWKTPHPSLRRKLPLSPNLGT